MKYFLFFLLIFSSASCYAESSSAGLAPFISVGLKGSYGSNGSSDGVTVKDRKLAVYGVDGILGLKWSGFIVGGGFDYNLWRQLTSPSSVGNSNTQGKQLNVTPVVGVQWQSVQLLGKYFWKSTYSLDKNDANGATISYGAPDASFALQARLMSSGSSYIGLEYAAAKYEEEERAGTISKFAVGKEMKFSSIGLLFGWAY